MRSIWSVLYRQTIGAGKVREPVLDVVSKPSAARRKPKTSVNAPKVRKVYQFSPQDCAN